MQMLREFDERQLGWKKQLLPEISYIPEHALTQAFIGREDGGLCILPVRAVAITAYVGSRIDKTAARRPEDRHSVSCVDLRADQLPGQRLVAGMTAPLPPMLTSL